MSGKIGSGGDRRSDSFKNGNTTFDRGSTYKLNRLKRERPEIAENKEPYNSNRYKPKI